MQLANREVTHWSISELKKNLKTKEYRNPFPTIAVRHKNDSVFRQSDIFELPHLTIYHRDLEGIRPFFFPLDRTDFPS